MPRSCLASPFLIKSIFAPLCQLWGNSFEQKGSLLRPDQSLWHVDRGLVWEAQLLQACQRSPNSSRSPKQRFGFACETESRKACTRLTVNDPSAEAPEKPESATFLTYRAICRPRNIHSTPREPNNIHRGRNLVKKWPGMA